MIYERPTSQVLKIAEQQRGFTKSKSSKHATEESEQITYLEN